MKQILLTAVCVLIGTAAWAQSGTGYGIRAGLSYNENGDLVQGTQNVVEGSEGNVGFHIGFWGKLDLPKIYLRPELIFSRTRSAYDTGSGTKNYDVSRLDLPLLVGYKLIGPLHVFIGPAFQYVLDNDLEDLSVDNVDQELALGFHVGGGINLGKIGVDIRYERGFSKNEADFIDNNITNVSGTVDTRPSQITLSASLKL